MLDGHGVTPSRQFCTFPLKICKENKETATEMTQKKKVLYDKNSIFVRREMQSKSMKITNGKKASGIQGNNI